MIACESFELIDVGGDASLLRLRARVADGPRTAEIVALVVRIGKHEQWLTPVPFPASNGPILSAAFAAPQSLVTGPASFSVKLDDGAEIPLPAPAPSPTRPSHDVEVSELRHRLVSAEAQLEETRSLAATMAAEVEEAQTRADALADVVRAETARREALQTRMIEDIGSAQAARADAEDAVARLERELRELRADR